MRRKSDAHPDVERAAGVLRETVASSPGYGGVIERRVLDKTGQEGTEFYHLPNYHTHISYNGVNLLACEPCNDTVHLTGVDALSVRVTMFPGYPWIDRCQSYSTATIRVYAGELELEVTDESGMHRYVKEPNDAPMVIPCQARFSVGCKAATNFTITFSPSLETAKKIDAQQGEKGKP